MTCNNCRKQLSENSLFCNACGDRPDPKQEEALINQHRKRPRGIIATVIVAVMLVGMISVSLCGCSGNTGVGSLNGENNTSSEPSSETDLADSNSENSEANEDTSNSAINDELESVENYLDSLELDVWDGSVAENYAGGSGTENDPYQISNGQELALFAQNINNAINEDGYYVLTQDILLNDLTDWENWLEVPPANTFIGVGTDSYPEKCFEGVFDGNRHTIYGLYSETGLFVCLHYGATIQNVNIDASVISSTDMYVGGLVDEINTQYTGDCSTAILNCSYNGLIDGSYAGGIVGSATIGDAFTIKYCKSSATINSNIAGGIIGCLVVDIQGEQATIEYCENYGDVEGKSTAGGIMGSLSVANGASVSPSVYFCRNCGNIAASSDIGHDGGIIGDVGTGAGETVSIWSCVNSASGGIIDGFSVGADGMLSISNCYYKSGSSAYNESLKLYIYGILDEVNLFSLKTDDFRPLGLPLYSDAVEALETGNYNKYNGKIYYMGYSGRLFRANYDGTQEEEIVTLDSEANWGMYENYLCYTDINSDGSISIILYDVETEEQVTLTQGWEGTSLLGTLDENLYYTEDNQVIKYSLPDGTKDTIYLDGLEGESVISMVADEIIVSTLNWNESTFEDYLIYSFYSLDGKLLNEVRETDFGESAVLTQIDNYLLIYENNTIEIYDTVADEVKEEIAFENVDVLRFVSITDEYIYLEDENGDCYKVNRADGSSEKC